MQLQQKGNNYALHLNSLPARDGLRPCANMMYESILNISVDEVTCVVLTGMGSDGTEGIKKLVHSKKVHLIAQDAASSVVYGMPKAIYDTGLVNEVVTLDKIADTIMKKVGVR
jgi:two-component system chemotaxis response regulator CheB